MSGKIAIVIVSDWDQKTKVISGLKIAKRINEARQENGIDAVEVFFYSGGAKVLKAMPDEVDQLLNELKQRNITAKACINETKALGLEENVKRHAMQLEFARDAFSRYAVNGYTVISF